MFENRSHENHRIHFNLPDVDAEYTFNACLQQYPLQKHNKDSLAESIKKLPYLNLINDKYLTHYIDVDLPSDAIALTYVTVSKEIDGKRADVPVSMSIHVPKEGCKAVREESIKLRSHNDHIGIHPKLGMLGIDARTFNENIPGYDPEYPEGINDIINSHDTAVSLLFHHPNLMTLRTEDGGKIPEIVKQKIINKAIEDKGSYLIRILNKMGNEWCNVEPILDEDGDPMYDESGNLLTKIKIHNDVIDAIKEPLNEALKLSQNDEDLKEHIWNVSYGLTSSSYNAEFSQKDVLLENAKDVSSSKWTLTDLTPSRGFEIKLEKTENDVIWITCLNKWRRHLSSYIQFLDINNNVIELKNGNGPWGGSNGKYYLNKILPPTSDICSIPMEPPDPITIITNDFKIPDNTHTISFLFGGCGIGEYDRVVCPKGLGYTIVVEMVLPTLCLAAGVAVGNCKTIVSWLSEPQTAAAMGAVLAFLDAAKVTIGCVTAQSIKPLISELTNTIGPVLVKPLLKLIASWAGVSSLAKAIPFVGIGLTVINTAVTVSNLTQTIVEVNQSPYVLRADVSRSIDLIVCLKAKSSFPQLANSYQISVVYDSKATTPQFAGPWPDNKTNVEFKDIPAGGNIKIVADFYAADGKWLVGHGESQSISTVGPNPLEVDIEIKTIPLPLSVDSRYLHKKKIIYEDGKHKWFVDPTEPNETLTTPSPYSPKEILEHRNITLSAGEVGYSWQARMSGEQPRYEVQNLFLGDNPEEGYASPGVGFKGQPCIGYNLTGLFDETGANFYVDPTKGDFKEPEELMSDNNDSGFHLRRVYLKKDAKAPVFETESDGSWGRFPMAIDQFVVHPQGYVFGINYEANKIFRLNLPKQAYKDFEAPIATLVSGEGDRDGLIHGPRALCLALDGRLLVLESVNKRIQAFDVNGNPVPYFNEEKPTMDLIDADAGDNIHYLDMSIESKGFIYVLSYINDGSKPEDYSLDIYKPDGTHLVKTTKVAAAKLAVSLERYLFTLNYEAILGKSGRPEPSISEWLPAVPTKAEISKVKGFSR